MVALMFLSTPCLLFFATVCRRLTPRMYRLRCAQHVRGAKRRPLLDP